MATTPSLETPEVDAMGIPYSQTVKHMTFKLSTQLNPENGLIDDKTASLTLSAYKAAGWEIKFCNSITLTNATEPTMVYLLERVRVKAAKPTAE